MTATIELNKIKGAARIGFSSHVYFWEKFAPKNATHMSFNINGFTNIIWYDSLNMLTKWDDREEWEKFSGAINKKAVRRPCRL